jgi:hypothetical protein
MKKRKKTLASKAAVAAAAALAAAALIAAAPIALFAWAGSMKKNNFPFNHKTCRP